MYIENEYQRLYQLVRDNLHGAKLLLAWQRIEQDPTENAYIVMWSRQTSKSGVTTSQRSEYGTHRAVVNETDGMLIWGHYFFNVTDAALDYNLRVNGTEHVS